MYSVSGVLVMSQCWLIVAHQHSDWPLAILNYKPPVKRHEHDARQLVKVSLLSLIKTESKMCTKSLLQHVGYVTVMLL